MPVLRFAIDETLFEAGISRQQAAARVLRQLGIAQMLADFTPVLAGTIPLEIDLPESDLDILCHALDLRMFARVCETLALRLDGYQAKFTTIRGVESFVAQGRCQEFEIEIFAQSQSVEAQWGYRHLLVEEKLLAIGGAALREEIRALKRRGLKTEPAFAQLLDLSGDPYIALLELDTWSDQRLVERVNSRRKHLV
ncbi:MAG: DUF4269 domain-containing protein [Planctomyces sp.]|nr:DUF4269 domain-containing protein [Planctomyces sp.]